MSLRHIALLAGMLFALGACVEEPNIALTVKHGDGDGRLLICDLAKCIAAGNCQTATCTQSFPLTATAKVYDVLLDDSTTSTAALQFTSPCTQLNVDVSAGKVDVTATFSSNAAADHLEFTCSGGSGNPCEIVDCVGTTP